jgi:hypothetical protein
MKEPIDGELQYIVAPQSYRLWHVGSGNEFIAAVADAGSFEDIRKVRRRSDWRYQITCDGKPIDERGFPILQEPGQDLTKKE